MLTLVFIVFEPEERAVRVDEILRFEAVQPDERLTTSRFGERAPDNARCRVHTKDTGWFYTDLTYDTVLERIQQAAEGLLS